MTCTATKTYMTPVMMAGKKRGPGKSTESGTSITSMPTSKYVANAASTSGMMRARNREPAERELGPEGGAGSAQGAGAEVPETDA